MTIMDVPDRTRPATAGVPLESPAWVWRSLAALGVAVSAIVHLVLWSRGYRDIDLVGPMFLLNATGGAVIAVALVTWRHWLPLLGAIAFGAATLIAFVASSTVGFLGVESSLSGPNEWVAAIAEVLTVVAATMALVREHGR